MRNLLPAAPAPLVVFFDVGSTTIRKEDKAVLDHASRAYSEGKPIVMILTGTADRTGSAEVNLELSQLRAAGGVERSSRSRHSGGPLPGAGQGRDGAAGPHQSGRRRAAKPACRDHLEVRER